MSSGLCNIYKDMVGEEGKGVRSYRIGSIPIIDLVLTIMFSAAIYQIPWVHARFNFRILTSLLLLVTTLMHRYLCSNDKKSNE